MFANKVKGVMGTYSLRIHHMIRKLIEQKHSIPVETIQNGLRMNPIPFEYELYMIPYTYETSEMMTHIPLFEDPDIGVSSKVIIWNPLAESDTHYHPNVHCFFTPVRRGLCHIENNTKKTELTKRTYTYIHDSIGPHRMLNSSSIYPNVSYHLYIQEDTLVKHTHTHTHTNTSTPKGSRSIHTEAYPSGDPDLFWYGTRS